MDSENVCSSGQTGSDRRGAKMTRLTHFGHLAGSKSESSVSFDCESSKVTEILCRERGPQLRHRVQIFAGRMTPMGARALSRSGERARLPSLSAPVSVRPFGIPLSLPSPTSAAPAVSNEPRPHRVLKFNLMVSVHCEPTSALRIRRSSVRPASGGRRSTTISADSLKSVFWVARDAWPRIRPEPRIGRAGGIASASSRP
jgi:hypothetical protein